jgi:uncharacterized protein YPO0396
MLVALGAVLLVGACGGGDGGSSSATTAPEERRTSDAEVATGLKKIDSTASAIAAAAATDKAKAKQLVEELEPAWKPVEGTVKANDQDTYIAFEDAFALLEKAAEDGDAAKASAGSASVSKATAAYLAKHPG